MDDGSRDQTWNKIKAASEKFPFVRGVHFSRNFGKEAAIMAGLSACKGDCSVVMISLGIIGYYIAKIHEEIKGRPRYIISEMCGEDE